MVRRSPGTYAYAAAASTATRPRREAPGCAAQHQDFTAGGVRITSPQAAGSVRIYFTTHAVDSNCHFVFSFFSRTADLSEQQQSVTGVASSSSSLSLVAALGQAFPFPGVNPRRRRERVRCPVLATLAHPSPVQRRCVSPRPFFLEKCRHAPFTPIRCFQRSGTVRSALMISSCCQKQG